LIFVFNISPKIVILSWNSPSHFSDEEFCLFPKINFFQKWVHPAINDAITSIELACMVSMMFFMAQNESGGLQESDDWMWLFVDHVSPFMDLIG
jgi:hypothetical protein